MEPRNLAIDGTDLQEAPSFGADGEWPPVVSDWVTKSWELLESEPDTETGLSEIVASALIGLLAGRLPGIEIDMALADAMRSYDVPDGDALTSLFGAVPLPVAVELLGWRGGVPTRIKVQGPDNFRGELSTSVLKRVTHFQRWQRNDPPLRLPSGASKVVTVSDTTGLSVEQSIALATSLGMKVTLGSEKIGAKADLNSSLQRHLGTKADLTVQKEETSTVTLSNGSGHSTVYALWHVDHRLSVDSLTGGFSKYRRTGETSFVYDTVGAYWAGRSNTEFTLPGDPHITSAESR